MKYGLRLRKEIERLSIEHEKWFDYKKIKKEIKNYKDDEENDADKEQELDSCCVCLEDFTEDNNTIVLGCCKNRIHVCCFVHTMSKMKMMQCFLCRKGFHEIYENIDEKNKKRMRIVSLMVLEFNKIEDYYKTIKREERFFDNKDKKRKYVLYNIISFIKILKKIEKHKINITRDFITNIMQDSDIYKKGLEYLKKNKEFSYLYARLQDNIQI